MKDMRVLFKRSKRNSKYLGGLVDADFGGGKD